MCSYRLKVWLKRKQWCDKFLETVSNNAWKTAVCVCVCEWRSAAPFCVPVSHMSLSACYVSINCVHHNRFTHLCYRPEQMTREVWDYVFFGGEFPFTDIPRQSLELALGGSILIQCFICLIFSFPPPPAHPLSQSGEARRGTVLYVAQGCARQWPSHAQLWEGWFYPHTYMCTSRVPYYLHFSIDKMFVVIFWEKLIWFVNLLTKVFLQ